MKIKFNKTLQISSRHFNELWCNKYQEAINKTFRQNKYFLMVLFFFKKEDVNLKK